MRRLTFFFILDKLQPEVETSKFLSPLQTDHSPAVLKLRSADSPERGVTGSSRILYQMMLNLLLK